MVDRRSIHDRVLNAKSAKELNDAYADWASYYDDNLTNEMGYQGYIVAAEKLMTQVTDLDARILDAGCGTGLVGRYLSEKGYRNLEGLDYSPEMLDQASSKAIYRSLLQADLTKKLILPDAMYDAAICVGTFTHGHVGPEAISELARVVKPGGWLCFTVRDSAWSEQPFQETLDTLEEAGNLIQIDSEETDYVREDQSRCQLCLCRIPEV